ncbi:MBL fold metallo-hydrolase [Cupriavidus oxalaticus]|uniref:MBL fold metallo-hydrolase n=1 Tax=Cupriavidus oxalaticus TaxID=96344 RepID=A0A375GCW6_9BURK|nr:MBL fold metallo-hydrolase [Cupriavidus oxalaticus]QEZ46201.1 MBL fold metallo-hydrolase [Cupriavidus oxalaticus]QRQ86389.1 MBL fold metallo-hydrolase [Cupriavidus oxalaticus]QRQ95284.1 MBL fold metallo-hydrolase [Cupriavidus oxalaticus]WQD83940.1 MBL fold metallo-hydrolase [Cupriavidus oxalaticus]SPC17235.1 Metal-dependent hydrolase of the beta-lactamase superfamily I [Cupriavidus oxalaticus]
MMRFAFLGSGSEGNSLLIESREDTTTTRVLLDCGFGIRETARRLERLGVTPDQLDAVLVTHEHGDHVGSAYAFAARHRLAVYTSHGTWLATSHMRGADLADVRVCGADHAFAIGGIQVMPYTVPHDAREPLQFVLSDGQSRLGVLTDAGMETPYVTARLSGVDALVLECNHDRELLRNSVYPASLKRRIGGDFGHLANEVAASILGQVAHAGLNRVVAAHLSKQNNTRELATGALAAALGALPSEVLVADQEMGLDWQAVRA